MKRFILTVAGYALAVILIVAGVNAGYKALDKNDGTKFANVPKDIEICNFGSSHGLCGFNYENISDTYTCFNFALESQYLSYDYRILMNYRDRLKEKAVVFITVSYFSFFGREETSLEDFASKNQRYYRFLPADLIKEYNWKTDFYVDKVPAVADYESLIRVLLGQRSGLADGERDSAWQQTADPEKIAGGAYGAYYRHVVKDKTTEEGERIYNQEEIEALYDIIELCGDCGAVPVLVTTPYLSEYTEAVRKNSPDFYEDYYEVLDRVKEETGVLYFDYAFDGRFASEPSLFLDADHLNKRGAAMFVDILMDEVVSDVLKNR